LDHNCYLGLVIDTSVYSLIVGRLTLMRYVEVIDMGQDLRDLRSPRASLNEKLDRVDLELKHLSGRLEKLMELQSSTSPVQPNQGESTSSK
jgi:hypothetical protein